MALPLAAVGLASSGLRRVIRRVADTALLVVFGGLTVLFIFVFGLGEAAAVWVIAAATVPPMTRVLIHAAELVRADSSRARSELAGGLNTSLLVAMVLLPGLALVGAGGIGRLQFRAINNLNVGLHVEAMLGLLAVAIAFDQLTRPTNHRVGAFLDRTAQAWGLRSSSEAPEPQQIPRTHRRTALPTVLGSLVALIGLALPWARGRATITSHFRADDLDRAGESYRGLHELGGGAFGVTILVLVAAGLLAVAIRAARGSGPPVDLTSVIGGGIVVVSLAYLTTSAGPGAAGAGLSIGALVSLIGGLIALIGTVIQTGDGAWSAIEPSARLGPVATSVSLLFAMGLVVAGVTTRWVRVEPLEILDDELQPVPDTFLDGLAAGGPGTGWVLLVASVLATALTVTAVAGVERARWIAMGLAFGAALGASAWIATTAIETDERYSTGGGPLLVAVGAAALMAIARRAPQRVSSASSQALPLGESS